MHQLFLSPRPQCATHGPLLLLLLLLLLGPVWHAAAYHCPQTCICDNARRHVACRHQNLTEVPNAIPEVSGVGVQAQAGSGIRGAAGTWAGNQWSCHCLDGDLGKLLLS
jgi:hypothetical protein